VTVNGQIDEAKRFITVAGIKPDSDSDSVTDPR